MLVLVAAAGWIVVGLLGLAVRVALFRAQRTQGVVSLLWGLGFALFIWLGVRALGLRELKAIPFALVSAAAIALFVYLRGAALEAPPAEQPGAFYRRRLARRRSTRAVRAESRSRSMTATRELVWSRVAVADGEYARAVSLLREAERVAVAQRKLDELLEVIGLLGALSQRSEGRTKGAAERLAERAEAELHEFPAGALSAAGIHVEPEPELPDLVRALRARVGASALVPTRELTAARVALDAGELASALRLLKEARRVAVAQRRLGELLEVHELVQTLAARSSGRVHTASERLALEVETGLREFAPSSHA